MREETNEQPATPTALRISGVVFFSTGLILLWIGFWLGPGSEDAIDGPWRLVFEVVPIQWFSWVMGVVFCGAALKLWISAGKASDRGADRAAHPGADPGTEAAPEQKA